jgi:hypothetical protein
LPKEFKVISLRASAKKIAEAKSKIIERPQQLFAEAKIVEFRGLFWPERFSSSGQIRFRPELKKLVPVHP